MAFRKGTFITLQHHKPLKYISHMRSQKWKGSFRFIRQALMVINYLAQQADFWHFTLKSVNWQIHRLTTSQRLKWMYPFDFLLYLWEIYSTSKEAEYSDVKMKIDKFFVSLPQRREFFARIKTDQVSNCARIHHSHLWIRITAIHRSNQGL